MTLTRDERRRQLKQMLRDDPEKIPIEYQKAKGNPAESIPAGASYYKLIGEILKLEYGAE